MSTNFSLKIFDFATIHESSLNHNSQKKSTYAENSANVVLSLWQGRTGAAQVEGGVHGLVFYGF